MNREERIEKARRLAAEGAPPPEDLAKKSANRISQRLANVGAAQAQRHVDAAVRTGTARYLDRESREWEQTVELVRLIAIKRATRRDTITSGEVRWAIFDTFRVLVGEAVFTDLMSAVNLESDGVLLPSIIIDEQTGKPDELFMLYADEAGFDLPLETLQRQVYSQFR